MGMFDEVKYEAPCWKCGEILKHWQSKDGPCNLLTLFPTEVDNFYDSCGKCGAWNEYDRVPPQPVKFVHNFVREEREEPE